jgi:DNA-binding NarL/FixJ family response regulator
MLQDIVAHIRVITFEDYVVTPLGLQPCSARSQEITINHERGEKRLNEGLLRQLVKHEQNVTMPEVLSRRETEVIGLVIEGLSNKDIAAKLAVSLATTKSHIRHILHKLGVTDRTQAAVSAIRYGIVKLNDGLPN